MLEVTAGQPVRIIQADGIVHAYSPLLVDRIVRGCGVEILHTAAPAANMAAKAEPVESYDDKDGYYEETNAARAPRRAAARPAKGATHARCRRTFPWCPWCQAPLNRSHCRDFAAQIPVKYAFCGKNILRKR